MSFKCSVFGHAYGDAEIEREREEDGSEVVTTIRETQTCERCGESRVVSENKEVTTLETAADIVSEDLGEDQAAEGGEPVDEQPATPTAPEPTEPAGEKRPAEPEEPRTETDIPDAETGTPAAGSQPGYEEQTTMEDSEGFDPAEADPETDDGVILDDSDDDELDDREPGEWPEEPDDGEDDWRPETEVDPTPEETTIEPTGSAVTVPEGEFRCPECEFSTSVESTSLRAGDFCPECHRGALEHATE